MINRRKFITNSVLAGVGIGLLNKKTRAESLLGPVVGPSGSRPLVISTWNHGLPANEKAWEVLKNGGSALDAAEQGVMVVEADPEGMSVGIGGLPDRDGFVTLDACIMDHLGNCGSVCFLEEILHPISVARLVMEKTPHVMLAGEGAQQFALENGFEKQNLLTDKAKKAWEKWKETSQYEPVINSENHDTIGLLALDKNGFIAGSCTTSGMGYKVRGRVGDSPIIGAGLFVDGEVGGAVATGHGEMMMKTLGSFVVVEAMRNGASPQEACEEAVKRIAKKVNNYKNGQAGFLAVNSQGETGAYAIHKGFNYALCVDGVNHLYDADFLVKEFKGE